MARYEICSSAMLRDGDCWQERLGLTKDVVSVYG
jgi:hypothetical protein